MKTTVYFVAIALFLALAGGCSNDSDSIPENLNQEQTRDFNTFEEFFLQDTANFKGWESSSSQKFSIPKTRSIERSSVKTITLNGYSSKVSSGNQKVLIGKTLAN